MSNPAPIDAIEALIHRDVGRNIGALFAAARGGLRSAATALAATPAPNVGILTGFYVPQGQPPAAETDGPAAAALLARGLTDAGVPVRLLTDAPCRSAVRAALDGAGLALPIDAPALDADPTETVAAWRGLGIDWVISIERCGPGADGAHRNMRGQDIGMHAAPLHKVFAAGPWHTIAVGDGGNEIGMGSIPRAILERDIAHGADIACVIPADHLIVAGVSHWGGYALLAALAMVRPAWRAAMLGALDPTLDRAILTSMLRFGPAVDGVTLRREATIDSLGMDRHHAILAAIRALAV